jgi:carboxyl-terminal processing protease
MLSSLDANGAFLSAEEVSEWKAGGPVGPADPGLSVVKTHGSFQVVFVAAGSPAAEAGIVVGDQIRKIGDRSARSLSLLQARRLLRGQSGTFVSLEVLHPDRGWARDVLELDRVKRSFPAFELDVRDGIGVLTVVDLERIEILELREQLADVRSRKIGRLMVDLRNVSEATTREAVAFLELFASNPVLMLKNRDGAVVETLEGDPAKVAWSGPLGVLVNGGTAGGAEAVAQILQSASDARVYGEATYGLGSEPQLFELEDGSGLIFSAAMWETNSGETWNDSGVEPDEPVFAEIAADQLHRALETFAAESAADEAREAA